LRLSRELEKLSRVAKSRFLPESGAVAGRAVAPARGPANLAPVTYSDEPQTSGRALSAAMRVLMAVEISVAYQVIQMLMC
jgi:hypothetical protein